MFVPDHVFVSHSADDQLVAQEVVHCLENAGIPVWVDYSHLTPGTPDWEIAIRDAVARSYALVMVASPSASQSRYVRAEIALAEAVDCRVFPIWCRGDRWIESIPLGLTYAQYIDLRGDAKVPGLKRLEVELLQIINQLSPSHYSVRPLRRFRETESTVYASTTRPPAGYISIELPSDILPTGEITESSRDGGQAAFFRLSELPTVLDLLDSLYLNYFKRLLSATDIWYTMVFAGRALDLCSRTC